MYKLKESVIPSHCTLKWAFSRHPTGMSLLVAVPVSFVVWGTVGCGVSTVSTASVGSVVLLLNKGRQMWPWECGVSAPPPLLLIRSPVAQLVCEWGGKGREPGAGSPCC